MRSTSAVSRKSVGVSPALDVPGCAFLLNAVQTASSSSGCASNADDSELHTTNFRDIALVLEYHAMNGTLAPTLVRLSRAHASSPKTT